MKKMQLLPDSVSNSACTGIYCEASEEQKYNAPNYFQIRNLQTDEIVDDIYFQEGPIKEVGLNGISNEDALYMVLKRLTSFQNSDYACSENASAIAHIKIALNLLELRTKRRIDAGVEGTSCFNK